MDKIGSVISKRFENIEEISKREIGQEEIHSLRVEIKKFRALLHIMKYANKANGKLKIPEPIKKWNLKAGECRNIQMTIKIISQLPINTETFIKELKKQEIKFAEEANVLLPSSDLLKTTEADIKMLITEELSADNVSSFIKDEIEKFEKNMASFDDDEKLHNIRKILKDLVYNKKIIQQSLPIVYEKLCDERIDNILTFLGRNQDLRIVLQCIENYKGEKNQPDNLTEIKKTIKTEKTALKEKIKNELSEISLKN